MSDNKKECWCDPETEGTNPSCPTHGAASSFAAPSLLGVGELVITRIKNRWGLECAGTIEAIHGDTADVRVWNMNGPGADMLVTGITVGDSIIPQLDGNTIPTLQLNGIRAK